jgi:hypothetical protein
MKKRENWGWGRGGGGGTRNMGVWGKSGKGKKEGL